MVLAGLPFALFVILVLVDWRIMNGTASLAGWILFTVGALVSLTNFYSSFIHFWVYKIKGGAEQDYKRVSGIPLLGALVIIGMAFLPHNLWLFVAIPILFVIDTGSITWFVILVWKDDTFWGTDG